MELRLRIMSDIIELRRKAAQFTLLSKDTLDSRMRQLLNALAKEFEGEANRLEGIANSSDGPLLGTTSAIFRVPSHTSIM
jgi:hypothetical protein